MLEIIIDKDGAWKVGPDSLTTTLWRNILSMTYMHPTLLIHPDLAPFREIFIENNVIHKTATADIFLPYPEGKEEEPRHVLRPNITYPYVPLHLIFGEVLDFTLSADGITVKDFRLSPSVQSAGAELAHFIRTYPKGLYEESFGFIYDFLIRFGLKPKVIESLVANSPVLTMASVPQQVFEPVCPQEVKAKVPRKSSAHTPRKSSTKDSRKFLEAAKEILVPPKNLKKKGAVLKGSCEGSLPLTHELKELSRSVPNVQSVTEPPPAPLPLPPKSDIRALIPTGELSPASRQDIITKYQIVPISFKFHDCVTSPLWKKYWEEKKRVAANKKNVDEERKVLCSGFNGRL